MEYEVDADASLEYATLQLFPSENRYEAFICDGNEVHKLVDGALEHLVTHLPAVKDLYSRGSNASFKLQLPGNLKSVKWFTKSTLSRFLGVVGSVELVNTVKVIEGEISQLEEDRKFHTSLHRAQPEAQIASSDSSKNELLRAIDLRLTSLRKDLVAAFDLASGATFSYEEITDLADFSQNFGALELRNFLKKFLEMSGKSPNADKNDSKSSLSTSVRDSSISKTVMNISKSASSEAAVRYGVSPAKAAEVERQNLTDSEESSDSSEENRKSTERSRAVVRSTPARRSASPMRRVQIGRTGPRRAMALTIKTLNYIPAREKTLHNEDTTPDSSEGEQQSGQPSKKPESGVKKMSVQDKINLFESRQKTQPADSQKRSSLANISQVSTNKTVLRRWSSDIKESSTECSSQVLSEDSVRDVSDRDLSKNSVELNMESGGKTLVETAEIIDMKLEMDEKVVSGPIDIQEDTDINQRENVNEKLRDSAIWKEQKEAELNQMLMKMMETQPVGRNRTQSVTRKSFPSEHRGGLYDHYKEKRDKKLLGDNSGKKAEKEAQFKAIQDSLYQRKSEMTSMNVNHVGKKLPQKKTQKAVTNSAPPVNNPRKEAPKPSATKKVLSKPSSLPVTRKSWPSTPSPRVTKASSVKSHGDNSLASTTPSAQKPQSATPSLSRRSPKLEKPKPQQNTIKETQANNNRTLKNVNVKEKQQQKVTKSSKTAKTNVATPSGDSSGTIQAKPSLYNKVTKKSSVVPLESKPFLRKGSGLRPGVGPVVNKVKGGRSDESLKKSGNLVEAPENGVAVNSSDAPILESEHQEPNIIAQDQCEAALEIETPVNNHKEHEETENLDRLAADDANSFKDMAVSFSKPEAEEESTISPTAWVEIEEHEDQPDRFADRGSQLPSSNNDGPAATLSPRVRHSLSQMLQEENDEPDNNEWGFAESRPSMIYHKDAPKGFKRLLKFARKSKGDTNSTGFSSPSVFSEGEDDGEDSGAVSKRNTDNLLRKAALHAMNHGQQKTSSYEGYERNLDSHEHLSDTSKFEAQSPHKSEKGKFSGTSSTTKASRSFFSLSAFRGSKPNETRFH